MKSYSWAILLIGMLGILVLGATPYAGGWNDGSRLASVEMLADHHTLRIDDSIFCRPSAESIAAGIAPYPADRADLLQDGTKDKLFIDGHFYSDKPALITFAMAGVYRLACVLGMPTATERPDWFCRVMTITTSGVAYALTVWALFSLGGLLRLTASMRLLWVMSFALATFALSYTRHVNNHVVQMASVAWICVHIVRLAQERELGIINGWRLFLLGNLAGLTFNLDLGSGPLLVVGLFALVTYRCQRFLPVALFVLATAPWIIAGMGVNYAIGGVLKPMNMVPEYSVWPGGPFTPENLTGFSRHTAIEYPTYLIELMAGKKGYLLHNLPLLLTLPAMVMIFRRETRYRAELGFAMGWCFATWLLYGWLSNNYGGACCSVRWFVPFLVPGYFLVGTLLQRHPEYRREFLILTAWGCVMAALMWWRGPWAMKMVPMYWAIVVGALIHWGIAWRARHLMGRRAPNMPQSPRMAA